MFDIEIEGLDGFERKLNDLSKRAKALDGEHDVSLSEVLTDEFMVGNTKFRDFDEMLENSGFKVEKQADFEAIPDDEWDVFVVANSRFSSWEEMLSQAGEIWMSKQLGL